MLFATVYSFNTLLPKSCLKIVYVKHVVFALTAVEAFMASSLMQ